MRETHFRQGRQTIKLGLIKVIHDLFPEERLKTAYSIPGGVFCNLEDSLLSVREVNLIKEKLDEWLEQNAPIQLLGRKDGYFLYKVGDVVVKQLYSAFTSPSQAEPFSVIPFSHGFIVYFGTDGQGVTTNPAAPYLLSATYKRPSSG